MSHRNPARLLTNLLALAFLFNAAARPLAMSASLQAGSAAAHARSGMPHHMAAPGGTHTGHTPAEHRHCGDECCGISVGVFAVSVAGVTIPVAGPATLIAAPLASAVAPRGVPPHSQPLSTGPPTSRA